MKFSSTAIFTIIICVTSAKIGKNKFVKEFVPVQEEPKSDYSCRGYVLVNDLKLLFCKSKKYGNNGDSLSVTVKIDAGDNDNPDGFDDTAKLVAKTIFQNANLTDGMDDPDVLSDEGSTGPESTSFVFYQLKTHANDKFQRFVQQLMKADFDPKVVNSIIEDKRSEDSDAVYFPATRDDMRYDIYGKIFKNGRKRIGAGKAVNKKQILDSMVRFYENFYSSDKMLFVIRVRGQLEESYMKLLAKIPKKKSTIPNNYKIGYELMIPKEKLLQVYFPLKHIRTDSQVSCRYLVYYFFNQDVSNSFDWMLMEAGLANKASAMCTRTSWSSKDLVFEISVSLTENGLNNKTIVLELIFSYLNRIKSMKIERWAHEAIVKMMDPYAMKTKYNLLEYISDVARKAFHHGLNNALVGPNMDFNEELIRNLLISLNGYNFNYICGISETSTNQQKTMARISQRTLKRLNNIRLKEADIVEIPTKSITLEQKHCFPSLSEFSLNEDSTTASEKVIINQEGKTLRLLQIRPVENSTFILFTFMIRLPRKVYNSVESYANLRLMIKSLDVLVNQELLSKMSGRGCYNVLIEYHHTGIKVLIAAEPEDMNFIADNIFHALKHKPMTRKILKTARHDTDTILQYIDFPMATYQNLLYSVRPLDDDMVDAMNNATVDSVSNMLKVLTQAMEVHAMMIAPIKEQVAIRMFNKVISKFQDNGATIQKVDVNWHKVLQLRAGSTYLYEANTTDSKNVALVAYQTDLSNEELVKYTDFFISFHRKYLQKQMSDYSKYAGIDIDSSRPQDGSIIYKIKGDKTPYEMEALLDKFLQTEYEKALNKYANEEKDDLSYYDKYSDPIFPWDNSEMAKKSSLSEYFPNRKDMIKVFRSMLDKNAKTFRKLVIYIYGKENKDVMESPIPEVRITCSFMRECPILKNRVYMANVKLLIRI